MKNNMKPIMENWRRKTVIQEARKIETAKDFVELLNALSAIKKGENLTKGGLSLVMALVGAVTSGEVQIMMNLKPTELLQKIGKALEVGGAIWDLVTGAGSAAEALKGLTRLPDEEVTKAGFLGILDINDNYLKLTDNRLENSIINKLLKKFTDLGDANIEDMDMNAEFAKAIKSVLGGTETLTGAPEKKMKDQSVIGKGAITKDRLKQNTPFMGDKTRD